MTLPFDTFIGLAICWLSLCCLCGMKRRYALFFALVFFGLSINSMWLSGILKVAPTDHRAVAALAAGFVCAIIAFTVGRFLSRIQAAWVDSRIEDTGV